MFGRSSGAVFMAILLACVGVAGLGFGPAVAVVAMGLALASWIPAIRRRRAEASWERRRPSAGLPPSTVVIRHFGGPRAG